MARGVGQDDLAAEARPDQVIRRALDVLVEVVGEPIGQVIDRDLAPLIDPLVERVAVVDQDLRNLDVEMFRPVGPSREPALRRP